MLSITNKISIRKSIFPHFVHFKRITVFLLCVAHTAKLTSEISFTSKFVPAPVGTSFYENVMELLGL